MKIINTEIINTKISDTEISYSVDISNTVFNTKFNRK